MGGHVMDKKKIKKIMGFFVGILILVGLNRLLCPTYFLYPDFLIETMKFWEIEQIWGEFDLKYNEMGAYYIYTDDEGQRHYYIMYSDDYEGRPIYIMDDTKIMTNGYQHYSRDEEPRYIRIETYIRRYAHECLNFGNVIGIEGACGYFGIEEGDFMRLVMIESEELMEHFSFDGEGYLERFEEKYGIEYTGEY